MTVVTEYQKTALASGALLATTTTTTTNTTITTDPRPAAIGRPAPLASILREPNQRNRNHWDKRPQRRSANSVRWDKTYTKLFELEEGRVLKRKGSKIKRHRLTRREPIAHIKAWKYRRIIQKARRIEIPRERIAQDFTAWRIRTQIRQTRRIEIRRAALEFARPHQLELELVSHLFELVCEEIPRAAVGFALDRAVAGHVADCSVRKRKADSAPTETARPTKQRRLTKNALVSSSAKAKIGDWNYIAAHSEPLPIKPPVMPAAQSTADKRKADSDPTENARHRKRRKRTSEAVVSSSAKAKIGDWDWLYAPPMPVTIEGLEGEEDDDDSATCEYVATLDNYDFEENDQDDLPSEPSTTNEATTGEATVEEEPTREENQEALVQRAPATPTRRARRTQVEILVEDASRFVTSSVDLGSGISMDGRRFSRRVASRNARTAGN